ncbi:hypothetical protein M4D71_00750 [Niallia taxi]|uniref:hypothetical protein n=1 Tax=Niallia taxi TaxID=2499688 RepID=UPI0021A349F0|nr:hypothetical protein [Niallia taxi]MCT2342648.1 hypothetical protein [Niallia taxi]
MNFDISNYPICDADIWVNICLGDFSNRIFDKHEKLIFADVVEKEILKWDKSGSFSFIADFFKTCKSEGLIHVIQHDVHIDDEDRPVLEQMLFDLDFKFGFDKNEQHKGEFVSAIYADHFNLPFMKTNDGAFQEGGKGKAEFVDLEIKNWYSVVDEYAYDHDEKIRVRAKVSQERIRMNSHKQKYEESKAEADKQNMLKLLESKFNSRRN